MWKTGRLFNWRFVVILEVVLFIIFGIPVWWELTNVYRAPLPFANQFNEGKKSLFPITLHIYLQSSPTQTEEFLLLKQFSFQFSELLQRNSHNFLLFNTKLHIYNEQILLQTSKNNEDRFDEILKDQLGIHHTGEYAIFILSDSSCEKDQFVFGKYRHAWYRTNRNDLDYMLNHIIPFVSHTYYSLLHQHYHDPHLSRDLQERRAMVQVKLSSRYRLTFSLSSVNPTEIAQWSFPAIAYTYLNPILLKLSLLGQFSIDSHIVYYTKLEKSPRYDSNTKWYYFKKEQLPYFVDSHSWNLDFISTDIKSLGLNFVVYVPEEKHLPLYILNSDGNISVTNGWVIPQWGGVVIWNRGFLNQKRIDEEETIKLLEVFIVQLRELLGFTDDQEKISAVIRGYILESPCELSFLPSPVDAFPDWELDSAIFSKLKQFQSATISSLNQFQQMLAKLTLIPVGDNIAHLIQHANRNLTLSFHKAILNHSYTEALDYAQKAHEAAEAAFFDADMIALLYFPDEHKYAVYLPLFLPLSFPITGVLWREYKRWKSRKLVPTQRPTFMSFTEPFDISKNIQFNLLKTKRNKN